jgi:hypothetical protein
VCVCVSVCLTLHPGSMSRLFSAHIFFCSRSILGLHSHRVQVKYGTGDTPPHMTWHRANVGSYFIPFVCVCVCVCAMVVCVPQSTPIT